MPAQNIEEAVIAAIDFFDRLYQEKGLRDVLLEEIRERDDETWEVTIGYSRIIQDAPPMARITEGPKFERVYKSLLVDKATGKVKSMMLRPVSGTAP